MNPDGNDKQQFFKTMAFRFNKCLSPTLQCPNKAIRAHSVQNATALSLIETNNHVSELKMRIVNDAPVCQFEKVGRNNASTFTGLCGDHDREIFRPIDTKPLDLNDLEQLFLIAYRSVTRELHATMEGASRIQSTYLTQVKLGQIPENEPTPAAIEATQHLLKSWSIWRYRYKYYDLPLTKQNFKSLLHSTFSIVGKPPVLAASSFFSVDNKPWGKDFKAVVLNVIPIASNETAVIFTYPKEHSGPVRRYISKVMLKQGAERELALSHLLIDRTENFFVSPSHVDNWSDEKRKHIEEAFFSTVTLQQPVQHTAELMLF